MSECKSQGFSNEIEAKEFIRQNNLKLKVTALVPNDKDLEINECFLIPSPRDEQSFGEPLKWEVIYRLPDKKDKALPL